MTITSAPLPENVFAFPTMPPGHDDADPKGNVLWFHPAHGWQQGWWKMPIFAGCTHWTYCPTSPSEQESREARSDRLFAAWIASFNHNFDDAARSLMKLGWDGAIKKMYESP